MECRNPADHPGTSRAAPAACQIEQDQQRDHGYQHHGDQQDADDDSKPDHTHQTGAYRLGVPLLVQSPAVDHLQEPFTAAETALLARFFTNVDRPVFGLVNLPEVVKGALFARYSRSSKSVRRLFLDEFMANPETGIESIAAQLDGGDPLVDLKQAEQLYDRVFFEYGDDSVAQLGGVHLAVEQASNVLTKVLEWGRLASYLEQSTRYIYYDVKLGERYRYQVPPEIAGSPLAADYINYMDRLFDTYSRVVATMTSFFEERFPKAGW